MQELAVHRSLVCTSPQENDNRLIFSVLKPVMRQVRCCPSKPMLTIEISGIRGQRKHHGLRVVTSAANAGELCQGDGTSPLTDYTGGPIPDLSQNG